MEHNRDCFAVGAFSVIRMDDHGDGPASALLDPAELRNARIRAGLTQGDLATRVGVQQPTVSTWERGKARPGSSVATALREALGLGVGRGDWAGAAAGAERPPGTNVAAPPSATAGEIPIRPAELREARVRAGLSQVDLAARVGVGQVTISHWETGRTQPRPASVAELRSILDIGSVVGGPDDTVAEALASSPFGEWLSRARSRAGLTRRELAERSGVSEPAIWNIESGQTLNPRASTRMRLEAALEDRAPQETVEITEGDAEIPDVGTFTDFDPHDPDDLPDEAGVYVFYDVSDRPIYVGESDSISRRIREHQEKFWYRRPIVESGAYVPIGDRRLRRQVEATMIKFLKSNAVINRQNVRR